MGQALQKYSDRWTFVHETLKSQAELENICRSVYVSILPCGELFELTQTLIDDFEINDEKSLMKLSEIFSSLSNNGDDKATVSFEDFVRYARRVFQCIGDSHSLQNSKAVPKTAAPSKGSFSTLPSFGTTPQHPTRTVWKDLAPQAAPTAIATLATDSQTRPHSHRGPQTPLSRGQPQTTLHPNTNAPQALVSRRQEQSSFHPNTNVPQALASRGSAQNTFHPKANAPQTPVSRGQSQTSLHPNINAPQALASRGHEQNSFHQSINAPQTPVSRGQSQTSLHPNTNAPQALASRGHEQDSLNPSINAPQAPVSRGQEQTSLHPNINVPQALASGGHEQNSFHQSINAPQTPMSRGQSQTSLHPSTNARQALVSRGQEQSSFPPNINEPQTPVSRGQSQTSLHPNTDGPQTLASRGQEQNSAHPNAHAPIQGVVVGFARTNNSHVASPKQQHQHIVDTMQPPRGIDPIVQGHGVPTSVAVPINGRQNDSGHISPVPAATTQLFHRDALLRNEKSHTGPGQIAQSDSTRSTQDVPNECSTASYTEKEDPGAQMPFLENTVKALTELSAVAANLKEDVVPISKVWSLQKRLDEALSEVSVYRNEQSLSAAQQEATKSELRTSFSLVQSLRSELAASQVEISAIEQRSRHEKDELSQKWESNLKDLQSRLSVEKNDIERALRHELDETKRHSMTGMEERDRRLRSELDDMQKQCRVELDEMRKTVARQSSDALKLEKQTKKSNEYASKVEQQASKLEEELKEFEKQERDWAKREKSFQTELNELERSKGQADSLRKSVELKGSELETMQGEIMAEQQVVRERDLELLAMKDQTLAMETNEMRLRQEVSMAKGLNETYTRRISMLETNLFNLENDINRKVQETMDNSDEKYRRSLESNEVLKQQLENFRMTNSAMQDSNVQERDAAAKKIEQLRSQLAALSLSKNTETERLSAAHKESESKMRHAFDKEVKMLKSELSMARSKLKRESLAKKRAQDQVDSVTKMRNELSTTRQHLEHLKSISQSPPTKASRVTAFPSTSSTTPPPARAWASTAPRMELYSPSPPPSCGVSSPQRRTQSLSPPHFSYRRRSTSPPAAVVPREEPRASANSRDMTQRRDTTPPARWARDSANPPPPNASPSAQTEKRKSAVSFRTPVEEERVEPELPTRNFYGSYGSNYDDGSAKWGGAQQGNPRNGKGGHVYHDEMRSSKGSVYGGKKGKVYSMSDGNQGKGHVDQGKSQSPSQQWSQGKSQAYQNYGDGKGSPGMQARRPSREEEHDQEQQQQRQHQQPRDAYEQGGDDRTLVRTSQFFGKHPPVQDGPYGEQRGKSGRHMTSVNEQGAHTTANLDAPRTGNQSQLQQASPARYSGDARASMSRERHPDARQSANSGGGGVFVTHSSNAYEERHAASQEQGRQPVSQYGETSEPYQGGYGAGGVQRADHHEGNKETHVRARQDRESVPGQPLSPVIEEGSVRSNDDPLDLSASIVQRIENRNARLSQALDTVALLRTECENLREERPLAHTT